MSVVASNNRAACAIFLLALLVTSSWCLASAVPAANARRLLQSTPTVALKNHLEALVAGVVEISNRVLNLLSPQQNTGQTRGLMGELQRQVLQVQQVATSLVTVGNQLEDFVRRLLETPNSLDMPIVQTALEALLRQLAKDLQGFVPRLRSPPPAGACFTALQADLVAATSKLTSQLRAAAATGDPDDSTIQAAAQALVTALQDFGKAVGQVDRRCAPGLLVLQKNGKGVVDAISELAARIQQAL